MRVGNGEFARRGKNCESRGRNVAQLARAATQERQMTNQCPHTQQCNCCVAITRHLESCRRNPRNVRDLRRIRCVGDFAMGKLSKLQSLFSHGPAIPSLRVVDLNLELDAALKNMIDACRRFGLEILPTYGFESFGSQAVPAR